MPKRRSVGRFSVSNHLAFVEYLSNLVHEAFHKWKSITSSVLLKVQSILGVFLRVSSFPSDALILQALPTIAPRKCMVAGRTEFLRYDVNNTNLFHHDQNEMPGNKLT